MNEGNIDSVVVTERINGWWVSVRFDSGHEEHHGPYSDQERAEAEADLLAGNRTLSPDGI